MRRNCAILRLGLLLVGANPGRWVVLAMGAVAVALSASAIAIAASSSLAIVHESVDESWRGAYDLLVRPSGASTYSVGAHAVVPMDFVVAQGAGITAEQWEAIARIPEVEVAAPVAALGWAKNATSDVGVDIVDPKPGRVYLVTTSAEIGGRPANEQQALFGLTKDNSLLSVGIRSARLPTQHDHVHAFLSLGSLPPVWGLIVGVDPEAEAALVGLDRFSDGTYLTSRIDKVFDPDFDRAAVTVPVLTAQRSDVPGNLIISVSMVEGRAADDIAASLKSNPPSSVSDLNAFVKKVVGNGTLRLVSQGNAPLADLLTPLRRSHVGLAPTGDVDANAEFGGGSFFAGDNLILLPTGNNYSQASADALQLDPKGRWSDVIQPRLDALRPAGWTRSTASFGADAIVYRHMVVEAPPPFKLQPIGTYDRGALQEQVEAAGNFVPLGIYGSSDRHLVTDASGTAVDRPLPPSINPGGLNPLPPVGITNLAAVQALRGDHFIDAIRVRVRGIGGYTPSAIDKVQAVAGRIINETGLHVDVVAGSSPAQVNVAVPGIGAIRERWMTLGSVPEIVSGTEGLSGFLLASAALVVVIYLGAFGIYVSSEQVPVLRVLRQLGWQRKPVLVLLVGQAASLGVLAALLSLLVTLAIATLAGIQLAAWPLAILVVAIVLGHVLSALVGGLAPVRPVAGHHMSRLDPRVKGISRVALLLSFENRLRLAAVIASVGISLALAGMMALIQRGFEAEIRFSVLGTSVAGRLAPYHVLALVSALLAAGALVLEFGLTTVTRRIQTIGVLRAVGWERGSVRRLIALEILIPTFSGGLLATLAVALMAVAGRAPVTDLWLILLLMGMSFGLGLVAAILPTRLALSASPGSSIRSQGAERHLPQLAISQALIAVMLLAVLSVVGVGALSAGSNSVRHAVVSSSAVPLELTASASRIRADVEQIAKHENRLPGSVQFEHALLYIQGRLDAAGYQTNLIPYLSRNVAWTDREGGQFAAANVRVESVVYEGSSAAAAVSGNVTFVRATEMRTAPCVSGAMVIRLSDEGDVPQLHRVMDRCRSQTLAVVGVLTSDSAWDVFRNHVAVATLPAARFLLAQAPDAEVGPWLVATLDANGPGATLSAAPCALALEVARLAAKRQTPLRIAIVAAGDGAAVSVYLEHAHSGMDEPDSKARMIVLGPIGGRVTPVIGTSTIRDLDTTSTVAGLLAIDEINAKGRLWQDLATNPIDDPTSAELLGAIHRATQLTVGNEQGINGYALAVGFDAAYLGEPSRPTNGEISVAGETVDTVNVVDFSKVGQLARGIADVIEQVAP